MKLRHFIKPGSFTFLCIALLSVIVLYPFFETEADDGVTLIVLNTLAVASGIYALSGKRWILIPALVFAAPFLASAAYYADNISQAPFSFHLISLLVFYAFTMHQVLVKVLHSYEIGLDEIIGALCVYLLLGLCWALVYKLVWYSNPDAFAYTQVNPLDPAIRFSDHVYFSFTTLTTLGYGDLLPVSKLARVLSLLEAICGVFFMAVLVGRLVGLNIARYQSFRGSSNQG